MSLPRVLLGASAETMDHATHRRVHGELPASARRATHRAATAAAGGAGASGLRGRGGGAFPLAAKVEAVQRAKGRPIVVVNGTEGEPMSVKDRLLLGALPHLVLDGAYCMADMLGTREIVVALDESMRDGGEAILHAIRERPEAGRRMGQPRVVTVPAGYVTGHETAIVNFVNRGIARPMTQPPRVSERGIGRRPTLMSNAETLAQVALIARHGAEWFAQLGPADEPGSALVTLSGAVRAPGVYEIEYGSQLAALVRAAGGVSEPVRAVLMGGYAGTWLDAAVDRGPAAVARRGCGRSAPRWARASSWSCPRAPARWPRSRAWRDGWPTRARISAGRASTGWPRSPTRSPMSARAAVVAMPSRTSCAGLSWSSAVAPARIPTAPPPS